MATPIRTVAPSSNDWTAGETVNTTTFDEVGGVTTVTLIVDYASAESRERSAAASSSAVGGRPASRPLTASSSCSAQGPRIDQFRRVVDRARHAPVTTAPMLAQIAAQARVLLGR